MFRQFNLIFDLSAKLGTMTKTTEHKINFTHISDYVKK